MSNLAPNGPGRAVRQRSHRPPDPAGPARASDRSGRPRDPSAPAPQPTPSRRPLVLPRRLRPPDLLGREAHGRGSPPARGPPDRVLAARGRGGASRQPRPRGTSRARRAQPDDGRTRNRHAEETPPRNGGRLRGVQLWVALPERDRDAAPAFEQLRALPLLELDGGRATVFVGELGGGPSPACST